MRAGTGATTTRLPGSHMSEYDGLWERTASQASWFDKATEEQRKWLEGLADEIAASGREPVWRKVRIRFAEMFGEDAAAEDTTIRKHVRYLVGKRG